MVTLKILPFGRVIFENSVIFANTCFPENKRKAPSFWWEYSRLKAHGILKLWYLCIPNSLIFIIKRIMPWYFLIDLIVSSVYLSSVCLSRVCHNYCLCRVCYSNFNRPEISFVFIMYIICYSLCLGFVMSSVCLSRVCHV